MRPGTRGIHRWVVYFQLLVVFAPGARAVENAVLSGRIADFDGKGVEGAEVFVYEDSHVKRPADFLSKKTGQGGEFSMVLPTGKYWAVARFRKGGERFGPLMPGDRHSGEPLEFELTASGRELNFTVAELREIAHGNQGKIATDQVKIQGRIVDRDGRPVRNAYAMASASGAAKEIPEYVSAWTDDNGSYTLFVPQGAYFVGASTSFPPGSDAVWRRSAVEARKPLGGVDIEIETLRTEPQERAVTGDAE